LSSSNLKRYLIPWIIACITFAYLSSIAVIEYTWLFASGDSGDWLFASTWWTTPQPYGSPLYIVLGHAVSSLPIDQVVSMTLLLSCLPAAITAGLVYTITCKLTGKLGIALTTSAVLIGMGVFLSQSTVLEQYSLAVMFLAVAIWFHVNGHTRLTYLALGLGTAVHVMLAPVAFFWLVIQAFHSRQWRFLVQPVLVYLLAGVAPYSLTLWLLAYGSPPLLAGYGLSISSINSYLGSTSVVGSLAIQATPERIGTDILFIVVGYGAALVPIWIAVKRGYGDITTQMLTVAMLFPIWYTVTCIDPTTWTFLIWGVVPAVVLAGIGLSRLPNWHTGVVVTIAGLLIITNTVLLNPSRLHNENPVAREFYEATMSLPDGAVVIMDRGGFESLGTFYMMSQGKDLIPVFYADTGFEKDALYQNYIDWMRDEYGTISRTDAGLAQEFLDRGDVVIVRRNPIPDDVLEAAYDENDYRKPEFVTGEKLNDWYSVVESVVDKSE
jgi:hypothetical protein